MEHTHRLEKLCPGGLVHLVGVVEATGGSSASGIGGGREAVGGAFTLNGGTVTALGYVKAIDYDTSFTVADGLKIQASTTEEGELGQYVYSINSEEGATAFGLVKGKRTIQSYCCKDRGALRFVEGERIIGAATLGSAIHHVVPAVRNNRYAFSS